MAAKIRDCSVLEVSVHHPTNRGGSRRRRRRASIASRISVGTFLRYRRLLRIPVMVLLIQLYSRLSPVVVEAFRTGVAIGGRTHMDSTAKCLESRRLSFHRGPSRLLHRTFSRNNRMTRHLSDKTTAESHTLTRKAAQDVQRVSLDDVDRLSRGQPAKRKGYGSRSVPHRLSESERKAFDRAMQHGFVTIDGSTGNRRERKGSPLLNSHRQYCDAMEQPQIVVYKQNHRVTVEGSSVLEDCITIDASPLRLDAVSDTKTAVTELLQPWMDDVIGAASKFGLRQTDEKADSNADSEIESAESETILISSDAWAVEPIWKLPVVLLGEVNGVRADVKAMAKYLADLWSTARSEKANQEKGKGSSGTSSKQRTRRQVGAKRGGRTKMKGLSEHRRQAFDDDIDPW